MKNFVPLHADMSGSDICQSVTVHVKENSFVRRTLANSRQGFSVSVATTKVVLDARACLEFRPMPPWGLEDLWVEAVEAMMVMPEREWWRLLTSGQQIELEDSITSLVSSIETRKGNLHFIGQNLVADLVAHVGSSFEPAQSHISVLTGLLGWVNGNPLYTDAYRHPQHRVLQPMDLMSVPKDLGFYEQSLMRSEEFSLENSSGWVLHQQTKLLIDCSGVRHFRLKVK
jgi:hypothetical protein